MKTKTPKIKTPYIDTHAHIYWDDYTEPLEELLQRAKERHVGTIILPGTNIETSEKVVKLVNEFPNVFGAVGIHPSDVKDMDEVLYLIQLKNLLHDQPKIVAIGEIGLDYYWDQSFNDKQKRFFHEQIQLAISVNKPVIIHNRNADDDIISTLQEYKSQNLQGVFHCFSGDTKLMKKALDLGFYISLAGVVTFKNSKLKEAVKYLPLDHLLTETDSPFLAPHPFRGKRNEPAYIQLIVDYLAEWYQVLPEDIRRNVAYNTFKLFGIGEKPTPSFVYQLGENLYINLTNRCTADCVFCHRKTDPFVQGYNLDLPYEPTVEEIIELIPEPLQYKEIVFCGYGEPTIRLDAIKKIATYLKEKGAKVRINTNGHGNIIHKRNIASELFGLIDSVSISLNALNETDYHSVMRLPTDKNYYQGMLDFALDASHHIPDVVLSVVAPGDADVSSYQNFVEKELGLTFRHRHLNML